MGLCRWIRRKGCNCCCVCKYFCLIIVLLFSFLAFQFHKHSSCDTRVTQNLIKELCHLYKTNKIAGSMCPALCDEGRLTYEKCTNYRRGKKVIFMQCTNCEPGVKTRVVLKSKKLLEEYETMHLPTFRNGTLIPQWRGIARSMLTTSLKSYFGIDFSSIDNLYSFLWGNDFDSFVKNSRIPNAEAVAVQTIWSLSHQLEYIFNVYLKDQSFVPKIYGTCGPAYISEYTPAVSNLEAGIFSWMWPSAFRKRVKVALEIMRLLEVFDHGLEQPLHLCDVKPDNFGVRANGEVTLVDSDCATFQEPLHISFFSGNCTSHDDCDFFDCRGYCDGLSGKCRQIRTNNNLQSICEDVFLGGFSKFTKGLLRDPPLRIQYQLNKALHECAYPGVHNERYVRRPASEDSYNEIVRILEHYLEET